AEPLNKGRGSNVGAGRALDIDDACPGQSEEMGTERSGPERGQIDCNECVTIAGSAEAVPDEGPVDRGWDQRQDRRRDAELLGPLGQVVGGRVERGVLDGPLAGE